MIYTIVFAVICFGIIVGLYNIFYELKKKNFKLAGIRFVIYVVILAVLVLIAKNI